MIVRVECYAGYKADERPLRFTLAPARATRERTYEVKEVLDQWYGVGYQCFKVRADDNNFYILRQDFDRDRWTLDSFRQASRE